MSGLFSTFNVAKRGMFVQQKAIDVTAHNIANANTEGYSRQRVKIETSRPFGMPTLNSVAEPGQLGTGSQIAAIERVRDLFLDYQFRVEMSAYGKHTARQSFLHEIESIFNEPSDTGLSTLIGRFFDSWQQLSKQPHSSNARTVVAQQSAALADELNHTYNQLVKLKENGQSVKKNSVFEINNVLNQLDQLNQQIIGVRVAGNMPNDLMDKRDLLIDELSSKFGINVDRKSFEGLDISPVDAHGIVTPNMIKHDESGEGKRLSYITGIEKDLSDPSGETYVVTYYKFGNMSNENNKMTMTITGVDEDAFKELEQTRVIWATSDGSAMRNDGSAFSSGETITYAELNLFKPSSGELNGYMTVQKDIDEYIDQLNKLAKAIAFSVNTIHSGKEDASGDRMPFFVNSTIAEFDSNNLMMNLGAILAGEKNITAGNISVNKEILADVMKIKTRENDNLFDYAHQNNIDGETDGTRALAIAGLRDVLMKVQDIGTSIVERKDLFDMDKGGNRLDDKGLSIKNNINGMRIDNYFRDTIDRLGVQSQEARRMVKNQESLLDSFEESRLSVSGVSLDEEMANLIQFQHAFNANAKIIATVDELLDVVVNGLKR
jgi:flagellar hook-associated protein 1